jgi:anti-sigma regulatory factor (Ser/Thr protein kinase)
MGEQVRLRLPCNPLSPRRARHEVVDYLASKGCERRQADVELVVSELVTNAVLHASSEVEVCVGLGGDGMTIEVSDHGQEKIEAHPEVTVHDEFGRGLNLVRSVADDWGSRRGREGNTVWCRLRCDEAAYATGRPSTAS